MYSKKLETNKRLECPVCGRCLDGITTDHNHIPTEGSITICMYCSVVCKFVGKGMNLVLEVFTNDDWAELMEDQPAFNKVVYWRKAVIKLMGENNS
jgi:C4-type Zn-finger protein